MSDSDRDSGNRRPRTRQAIKGLKEGHQEGEKKSRRSTGHSSSNPEHLKKCFICYSEVEREKAKRLRKERQSIALSSAASPKPSTSKATSNTPSRSESPSSGAGVVDYPSSNSDQEIKDEPTEVFDEPDQAVAHLGIPEVLDTIQAQTKDISQCYISSALSAHKKAEKPQKDKSLDNPTHKVDEQSQKDKSLLIESQKSKEQQRKPDKSLKSQTQKVSSSEQSKVVGATSEQVQIKIDIEEPNLHTKDTKSEITAHTRAISQSKGDQLSVPSKPIVKPPVTLASSTKPSQPTSTRAAPGPVPPPVITPSKPTANDIPQPTSHPTAHIPKQTMSSGGPLTRLQAQGIGALDGGHLQISAANIDEATLDECFKISPKWHFIKTNHEETAQWLEGASSDSILTELLYFAHDQGQSQHKELEGQFEKELEQAMQSIEKLDCLDAFCKTFIRENQFRPAGRVITSGSSKDEKYNRLFRMINADLQNLQRQHRILSMVCRGTADHEVHTQAQRENLRKLVEDLVSIVHPGDRGTYSEVYKVITESAQYSKSSIKPQLSSLKLVAHPDITVPFGGPIIAGGSLIRCDALEHKIRAKLPSLLIKMHFSDNPDHQKWPDLSNSQANDSGIGDASILDDTGTGSTRSRGKDDKSKTTPTAASKASGKRKHEDTPPSKSKRHREDLHSHDTQRSMHVIDEIYGEHVAELICSLTSTPLGYIKHCKHSILSSDNRDGTANVTVLGLIVSGEKVYLTKMDASHDYLDSMVETFRMDQLSFSCMANPINLYKGTHLKALLLYLRYICLNFPRTTYFLSD